MRHATIVGLCFALFACGSSSAEEPAIDDGTGSGTGGTTNPGTGGRATDGGGTGGTKGTGGGAAGTGGTKGTGGGAAGTGGATGSGGGAAGTGGTTGTGGGTTGTGGSHDSGVPVGNCANLGAPGTWEHVTPTGTTDSCVVRVDPFDPAIVWSTTSLGLHKSTDCGSTWKLVSTGRNGPGLAKSSLWSMAVDPVDRGTIYLVGGYGALGLWKSTNGGVDWDGLVEGGTEYAKVQQYRFVNNISMDPSDHLHLVFATHGNCDAPYAPNCNGETFDGGKTIKLSIAPDGWPEGGGVFALNKTDWLWSSPFGGLWLTKNNGTSFTKVRNGYGGNGEFTTAPLVPASDSAYYLSSIQGILRSTDGAQTWTQPKTDGRYVGFAMSDTTLYAADQWSAAFVKASISDPTKWTSIPPPAGLTSTQGAPFLDYDSAHHILYASTWPDGLWRIVQP